MSMFRENIDDSNIPDGMTMKDVIDWIETVYAYCDPHTGEHAFGVLDYQYMEQIASYLLKRDLQLTHYEIGADAQAGTDHFEEAW